VCECVPESNRKRTKMKNFDHENLDVYKVAIEFVTTSNQVIKTLPKGKHYLVDQLQRASASIVLNIAEGAGEYAHKEKARFYRIAKRSATECAAILDICHKLNMISDGFFNDGRELLVRIVSMLVRMVKVVEKGGRLGRSGRRTLAGSGPL